MEVTTKPLSTADKQLARLRSRPIVLAIVIAIGAAYCFWPRDKAWFPGTVSSVRMADAAVNAILWLDEQPAAIAGGKLRSVGAGRKPLTYPSAAEYLVGSFDTAVGRLLVNATRDAILIGDKSVTRVILETHEYGLGESPRLSTIDAALVDQELVLFELAPTIARRAYPGNAAIARFPLSELGESLEDHNGDLPPAVVHWRPNSVNWLPKADYAFGAVSPNGRQTASTLLKQKPASWDFELTAQPPLDGLPQFEGSVTDTRFVRDDRLLACERGPKNVGTYLHDLRINDGRVVGRGDPLTLSNDRRHPFFYAASDDGRFALLHTATSGQTKILGWPVGFRYVAFWLVDLEEWKLVAKHAVNERDPFRNPGGYPHWSSASFAPDGKTLLFGTTDGRVLTVDIAKWIAASRGRLDD